MHLSRNLLLNFVSSENYLSQINSILKIANASVSENESRMPNPPFTYDEADNNKIADMLSMYLGSDPQSNWWRNVLKKYSSQSWDFTSTCTIDGKKGILLVEAKAKRGEIKVSNKGKAIEDFSELNKEFKEFEPLMKLDSNKCPQLTKHIAHSYSLAKQDLPVILLYLCFRFKNGKMAFKRHFDWKRYLINTARFIGAQRLIDTKTFLPEYKSSFTFLCGSVECGNWLPDSHPYPKHLYAPDLIPPPYQGGGQGEVIHHLRRSGPKDGTSLFNSTNISEVSTSTGSSIPQNTISSNATFKNPKGTDKLSSDVTRSTNKKHLFKDHTLVLGAKIFRKKTIKKISYKKKIHQAHYQKK